MHGNIREWCADGAREYREQDVVDPVGEPADDRVLRGGSWFSTPAYCRCASRVRQAPDYAHNYIGCRMPLEYE
jgi:formylglycine-generating enzyme required for sulfatase activity